jgi:hypothetical protein
MNKRNILLCIFAVLLAFTVTISCGEYPITIKPVLIEEGRYFGSGCRGNYVIKTQAEWDYLICSRFWGDSAIAACRQDFAEKKFNFDMYQIIAVIDWLRPHLGWSINIVSIQEYSDDIVVSIYIKESKGPAPSAVSQPYQIVKIPVTAKDVVFKYINYIPPLPWAMAMAMEACYEKN